MDPKEKILERNKEERRAIYLETTFIACVKSLKRRQSKCVQKYIYLFLQTENFSRLNENDHSDPSLKRSLCFLCNSALVPGVSVSVRVKGMASFCNFSTLHEIITVYLETARHMSHILAIHLPEL
jgi:RNase P subunit RPR2